MEMQFCRVLHSEFVKNSTQKHCNFHLAFFQLELLYSSINTATAWKNSRFILSGWSDFHILVKSRSYFMYAYAAIVFSKWDSANEVMKWSIYFRNFAFKGEMASFWLKPRKSVLSDHVKTNAFCSLCSRDPSWAGVFARNTRSPNLSIYCQNPHCACI